MRREKRQVLIAIVAFVLLSAIFMSAVAVSSHDVRVARPRTRVACVGDSLTEGTLYPSYLRVLLGNDYFVSRFGAGGSTALLSSDNPYMNTPVFVQAEAYHADIVIILLGTNDANPLYFGDIENFAADYKQLVQKFAGSKIWLAIPPPIFNDGNGLQDATLVSDVIPGIEQVATELNQPTIDQYTLLSGHPELFDSDGVHPNSEGAQVIAEAVYSAITQRRMMPDV
jgi:sialate O-acetylesterase